MRVITNKYNEVKLMESYTRFQFATVFIAVFVCSISQGGCAAHTSSLDLNPEQQAYLDRAMQAPLEFTVSKEEVDEAWERARDFIRTYSSTGVSQANMESEFRLVTGSPRLLKEPDLVSYEIVKAPLGDDYSVKVKCLAGYLAKANAKNNCQILAYYVATGDAPDPSIVYIR